MLWCGAAGPSKCPGAAPAPWRAGLRCGVPKMGTWDGSGFPCHHGYWDICSHSSCPHLAVKGISVHFFLNLVSRSWYLERSIARQDLASQGKIRSLLFKCQPLLKEGSLLPQWKTTHFFILFSWVQITLLIEGTRIPQMWKQIKYKPELAVFTSVQVSAAPAVDIHTQNILSQLFPSLSLL